MYTLGINAAFHDSAAALLCDGVPLAAAEEERFTRIKHAKRPQAYTAYQLPFHAIDYCLREAGIALRQVDRIAYAFDPALAGVRRTPISYTLPATTRATAPAPAPDSSEQRLLDGVLQAPRMLLDDLPHHLFRVREGLADHAALPPFEYVEHHLAHAASAYYSSGWREAAILTLDARGERATTVYAVGQGAGIAKLGQVELPHSLGILYANVTSYLGFLHTSDEYKVMALAATGSDRFVSHFRAFVQTHADGRFTVQFGDLEAAFGPRRRPDEPLAQRHRDVATALQRVLEECVLTLAQWLHARTGMAALCLAGGVALNCVLNARLRDEGPFTRIFVPPAPGDAGTALGAAYLVDARERSQRERSPVVPAGLPHAYLGPAYADDQIRQLLQQAKLRYTRPRDIATAVAARLARGQVVGWFQGRMEFGPRALGARSVVASPLDPRMPARLNALKGREGFQPVAPAVLAERMTDYFEPAGSSPFMQFVHRVHPEQRHALGAVAHADGTARVQTVDREQAPLFHRLIAAFAARTGVPVVVNTSFNARGEPIVCTPHDALACYATSGLDALALGPYLLAKAAVDERESPRTAP